MFPTHDTVFSRLEIISRDPYSNGSKKQIAELSCPECIHHKSVQLLVYVVCNINQRLGLMRDLGTLSTLPSSIRSNYPVTIHDTQGKVRVP